MDQAQDSSLLSGSTPSIVTNSVSELFGSMTISSQDTHATCETLLTNSVPELFGRMPVNSEDTHELFGRMTSMSSQDIHATGETPVPGLPHNISEDVIGEHITPMVPSGQPQLLLEMARMTSQTVLPELPRCDDLITSKVYWEELQMLMETSRMESMPISGMTSQILLWGFRDQMSVDLIIPKLSLRESHILSSLCWERLDIIRTRQVSHTKSGRSSTHTFVLLSFTPSIAVRVLVLYSIRDGLWILLPPIPAVGGVDGIGSPCCSEIVVQNGKIYVIGGGLGCIGEPASNRVYVLDISGNKCYWQRCANMKEPRASFGSAVLDGKIYVFGGISSWNTTDGSEVYDPEENSWSSIMSMRSFSRFGHRVATMGDEITLQGGSIICDREFHRSERNPSMRPSFMSQVYGDFMDIYSPGKDEWTTTMPLIRAPKEVLFVVSNRLYSMSHCSIHVLGDRARNSWIKVHSFKLPVFAVVLTLNRPSKYGFIELEDLVVVPTAVLAVNDELVAIFAIKPGKCIRAPEYNFEYMFARSHGFRTENVEISWEEIEVPRCFAHPRCWYQTHSMSMIQL